jgi:hypothetical protein
VNLEHDPTVQGIAQIIFAGTQKIFAESQRRSQLSVGAVAVIAVPIAS